MATTIEDLFLNCLLSKEGVIAGIGGLVGAVIGRIFYSAMWLDIVGVSAVFAVIFLGIYMFTHRSS